MSSRVRDQVKGCPDIDIETCESVQGGRGWANNSSELEAGLKGSEMS